MKQTKLFIISIILASVLCFSCKGNNSKATAGKDSAGGNTGTARASSSSDASFSSKIAGKDFSANGGDNYVNAAFKNNSGVISFGLVQMDKTQKGVPAQFNFSVADHGTTTMHNSNSTDNGSFSAKYTPSNTNDAFGFQEVTVTITSSDASGNFFRDTYQSAR